MTDTHADTVTHADADDTRTRPDGPSQPRSPEAARATHVVRAVAEEEFAPWARMIADTYGADRTAEQLARQRAATALDRTFAVFDGDEPVGGLSVYPRELTLPGALRSTVAGIASVGVAPTHRRRGVLTAMMRAQLTAQYESGAEALAVLRPSEAAIYGRYGYGPATRGSRFRCEKREMRFGEAAESGAGTVRLLARDRARPVIEEVYDLARRHRVGWPDRQAAHWEVRLADEPGVRGGATALRFAVHTEPDGRATGYALYRHSAGRDAAGNDAGTVQVEELAALPGPAYAALWRYLAGIDLLPWLDFEAAADEPLPHLLTDPRAVRQTVVDRLWVRTVDVARALTERRYSVPLDLVLEVEDAFCPWNTGRYRLETGGGDEAAVRCERTREAAEVRLTAAELGAAYLGGTTLSSLAAAGRAEELRPGALGRASAAFRTEREPYYPGGWAFPLY